MPLIRHSTIARTTKRHSSALPKYSPTTQIAQTPTLLKDSSTKGSKSPRKPPTPSIKYCRYQGLFISSFKSPSCWNALSIIYQSAKKYDEAKKALVQASQYDPENLVILRDLSHLQVFREDYESFLVTRRKMLSLKSSVNVHWIGLIIANYLTRNYENAYKVCESYQSVMVTGLKEGDLNDLFLFRGKMLYLAKLYKQAAEFLVQNQK